MAFLCSENAFEEGVEFWLTKEELLGLLTSKLCIVAMQGRLIHTQSIGASYLHHIKHNIRMLALVAVP